MVADTPKPHVVILPSPGMGHLIPVLELSKRLVTLHSVHVTLFIIPTTSSTAQSQLLQSSQLPNGLHIVDLQPVNISDSRPTSIEAGIYNLMKSCLPALQSKIANMKSPPSALILDMFGYAVFDVHKLMEIPKYILITSTAWFLALAMYAPVLDREVEGQYVDLKEPILIPGCKPLQVSDIVDPLLDRNLECYHLYLRMAHGFRMAQGLILNTWEDLEPRTLRALRDDPILRRQIGTPPIYPVGPLVTMKGQQDDTRVKDLFDWLHVQPKESVIYVSFGSGGTLSQEQVTELAWGLEMSQQRFIWVVRPPPAENVSDGTYFSTGSKRDDPSNYLPEGFLKRIEGGVGMVVPEWAPQVDILSHPSTGGFLSHCGWNSALESIINGVPMIAWPLYAEQKMNASLLVEDLGVAVRSEGWPTKGVVKREEIERMVRLVMEGTEGEGVRGRMKDLQNGALKAVDKDGSSYNTLSQLLKEWEVNPEIRAL